MAEELNQNTLSSEIVLDIGTSIDSANLAGDLDAIGDSVAELGKAVADANKSMPQFVDNIARLVETEIKKMGTGELKVGASGLFAKVERAIVDNVMRREIQFDGTGGADKINITPNEAFWNKFNKDLQKQMKASIDGQQIDFTKVKKFNLEHTMNYISRKLNTDIGKAIENGVDFATVTTKGGKITPKIFIDKEHLDTVTTAFENSIVKSLSHPDNIILGDMPKLNIKSEGLTRIVETIKKSIGNIDESLKIDGSILKDIPNVSKQMGGFEENLKLMYQQVTSLSQRLQEIDPSLNPKQMEKILQGITTIKHGIGKKIESVINTTISEVGSLPVSTYDYAQIKTSMEQFGVIVNKEIMASLQQATVSLTQSLGIAKANVGGQEVFVPSVKALQDKLASASKQAVTNMSSGDYTFDTSMVQGILQQMSSQFNAIAENSTREAMSNIITELLTSHEQIVSRFRNLATGLSGVVNALPDDFKAEASDITIDSVKLKEKFDRSIGAIVVEMVNNLDIKAPSIAKFEALDIEIPESATYKIQALIKKIVGGQINQITSAIQPSTKATMPEGVIAELNTLVDKEVNSLVDTILAKTRSAITAVTTVGGVNMDALKDDKAILNKSIENNVSDMLRSYVSEVGATVEQVSLNVTAVNEITESLRLHVMNGVRNMVSTLNFAVGEVPEVALESAIIKATDEVEKAVMRAVNSWDLDVASIPAEGVEALQGVVSAKIVKLQKQLMKVLTSQMSELLNSNSITKTPELGSGKTDQLKKLSETGSAFVTKMVDRMSKDIIAMLKTASTDNVIKLDSTAVSKLLKPVGTVVETFINSQVNSMVTAVNQATTQTRVSTKNLSAEVRKRMASEMSMSVQQLGANFPVLEGQQDMNMVMRHSMQTLVDKFNDALLKSTQSSLKDLQKSLKSMEFEADTTVVHLLANKMNKLQSDINTKVRQMLKVQFDALTDQIKQMKIYPTTVGYTPSATVSKAYNQGVSAPIASRSSIGSGYGTDSGSRRMAYANPMTRTPNSVVSNQSPINMNKFSGHVMNTMRYMTAGALMGAPLMALNKGFQSTKAMEYDVTKAQQNFVMKDPSMHGVATKQIFANSSPEELEDLKNNSDKLNKLIEQVAGDLRYMSKEGSIDPLLKMANAYSQSIEDAGLAFHIASRNIDNPNDALAFSKETLKLKAIENVDIETASKGLQAIQAQWGLVAGDLEKVNNMLIKTATLSSVTAEDLIQTQQASGALFRNNLGGMEKGQAIATSFGLSSLFTEATARSGKEGGTYYKAILDRPYQEDTRNVLEGLASYKGFEGLSPYREDGVTKKDYVELLGSIIDVTTKLDDRSRVDLVKQLFPSRHGGSAEAISNLLLEMKTDIDNSKAMNNSLGLGDGSTEDTTTSDALKAFVDKIASADNSDTEDYVAGMKSSWQMAQQGTSSLAQSAGYKFFENYQDEFTSALTYLNSFLRVIQDNVGVVSKLMELGLAYVGAVYGKDMIKKMGDSRAHKKEEKSKPKVATVDGKMVHTEEEADAYNDKSFEHRSTGVKRQVVGQQIEELKVEQAEKASSHADLGSRIETAKLEYNKMNENKDISAKEKSSKSNEIKSLQAESNKLEKELKDLSAQMGKLDDEEKRLAESSQSLEHEMNQMAGTSTILDNKFDQLELALTEAGIDTQHFYKRLNELQKEMGAGKFTIEGYNSEIRGMGRQLGLTDTEIDELRRSVDTLNDEFARGKITAKQYADGIKQVKNSANGLKVSGAGTGVRGGAGGSLMNDMVLSSSVAGGTGKAGGLGAMLKLGGLGALASKGMTALKGGGAMAKVASAGAKVGKFGKFMKGVPMLGWALAAIEVVPLTLDALSNIYSTEGEKLTQQSQKKKNLAQSMLSYKKTQNGGLQALQGAMSLWDVGTGGLNQILGGNHASWGEGWNAWWDTTFGSMKDATPEELEKHLKSKLGYDALALQGNKELERERLAQIDPYRNMDGTLNTTLGKDSMQLSLESIQEIMSLYSDRLSTLMQKEEGQYTVTKLDLLLRGYAEDSDEIKKETISFLGKNIDAIDKLISELSYISTTLVDSPAKDLVLAQIAQYQMQNKESQLQIQQIKDSELDSIMNKFDRARSLMEADYSIKGSDLIIGGASSDSSAVKGVEKSKNKAVANRIEQTQGELRSLLGNYAQGTKMHDTIWLQIMQLEAEQKGLLADIKQNTNKTEAGTFNLPSGIQPMTYWEAMTKKSNYKNVSVKSGDVNVNITIDKMSGDTKDVEKMTAEIGKVVQATQKGMVYQFDRDVKSGMASNYFPHTR